VFPRHWKIICSEFGLYIATTVDEWAAILDLAAKWNFKSIKALAIRELAPIASPIDMVVLGRRHQINEWLGGAYLSICARLDPLTYQEGMRLGMEDVIKISAIRHEYGFGPVPLMSREVQRRFGLDIGLCSPSRVERNVTLPEPGDVNPDKANETYLEKQEEKVPGTIK